jgi:L,D-transpeptidase ErfK/SrfK
LGDWKIVDKVKNPSWHNPHAAWSATMPEYIPPGPSNPLGTRALYLDASGIRFHGTNNIGSVGTPASHGCMRMYMSDIEALYPLVPIGTKVWIRK